jgi:(p)ppGpp synthase/HD superfamily hydrolase
MVRSSVEVKGMDDDNQDLLERAIACAFHAHAGQKYPSPEPEPYILHPLRVMCAVEGPHARMAAVLHDVIEDTDVTLADLQIAGYPRPVIDAVDCLTHRDGETYARYIERVATDPLATIVKVADLRDNLRNNKSLPPRVDVIERIQRYEQALSFLEPRLHELAL